jgi:hypothetical protein
MFSLLLWFSVVNEKVFFWVIGITITYFDKIKSKKGTI